MVTARLVPFVVGFEVDGVATWRYNVVGEGASRGAWVRLSKMEIEFRFDGLSNEGVIIPPSNLVFVWKDDRVWMPIVGKEGVPLRRVDAKGYEAR
jgi:hypothetical protein